jgi:ankyrin repeat protein
MNEVWNKFILQNAIEAAFLGDMKQMQKTIELKININMRLEDGTTPLEIAAEEGDANLIEFLLKAGADPKIGEPLLIAAFRGWTKIYDLLFNLVDEEARIEAIIELPKGIIRRAKAENDPDYDWDD